MTPERLAERKNKGLTQGIYAERAQLIAEVERLRAGIEALHRPERMYASCIWLTCDNEACQESTRDGERFHADEPTGLVCWECLNEDGDPHDWPCPTAALLNPPTEEPS